MQIGLQGSFPFTEIGLFLCMQVFHLDSFLKLLFVVWVVKSIASENNGLKWELNSKLGLAPYFNQQAKMSFIRISFILIVPFMVLFSGEENLFCLHWQNLLVFWKNLFQITKTLMANCRDFGWLTKWKIGPLPFVPLFSHTVVSQWPVEPPQVHHGHMMAWAKFDGLLVMGHCLLWKACNQW